MDKENLFSHKKLCNYVVKETDASGDYPIKWYKPDSERQLWHIFFHSWTLDFIETHITQHMYMPWKRWTVFFKWGGGQRGAAGKERGKNREVLGGNVIKVDNVWQYLCEIHYCVKWIYPNKITKIENNRNKKIKIETAFPNQKFSKTCWSFTYSGC